MNRCYAQASGEGTGALTSGTGVGAIQNMIYAGAAVTVRATVYDIIVSSGSTPGDAGLSFAIRRTTTAAPTGGTAVGLVPVPMDFSDAASNSLGACGGSTPLATATMIGTPFPMTWAQNQRVTWRWCAVPGGEILQAAVVYAGIAIALLANAGTVPTLNTTIFFRE
jgi:hypothetical protein